MKYSKIFKIELIINYIISTIIIVQVLLLSGGLSRYTYFEFLPNVSISSAIQAILFFGIDRTDK